LIREVDINSDFYAKLEGSIFIRWDCPHYYFDTNPAEKRLPPTMLAAKVVFIF